MATRRYRHYTEDEDKLILAPNLTIAQIARQLDRKTASVIARRKRLLGLSAATQDGLLPCPFCPDGGAPYLERAGTTALHWGACRKCRTQGPPRLIREQAITAWNTRQRAVAAP